MKTSILTLTILLILISLPLHSFVQKISTSEISIMDSDYNPQTQLFYIVTHDRNIDVLDAKNPSAPIVLGSMDLGIPGGYVCIKLSGEYAYVFSSIVCKLFVINVSNPHHLTIEGHCDIPNINYSSQEKIDIEGNILYLTTSAGLKMLDVSNPQQPAVIQSYPMQLQPDILSVKDHHVYLFRYNIGLQIWDFTDPSAPVLEGGYASQSAGDLYIQYNTAYLLDNDNGLLAIDITAPHNPVLKWSLQDSSYFTSITIHGNFAYLTFDMHGQGIKVYDISNPGSISLVDIFESSPGGKLYASADNEFIYCCLWYRPFEVLLRTTDNVPEQSLFDYPDRSYVAIYIHNNTAYMLTETPSIVCCDLSDEKISTPPLELELPSQTFQMAVKDNSLFCISPLMGVQIYDIQDPLSPIAVKEFHLAETTYTQLAVENGYMFIITRPYGAKCDFSIVDYSTQSGASLVNQIPLNSTDVTSMLVKDSYAYLGLEDISGINELMIIDISDPLHPEIICRQVNTQPIMYLQIMDQILYYANGHYNIVNLIDCHDISNPCSLGMLSLKPSSMISAISVSDNLLFIADPNWSEISIYNISNPADPHLIRSFFQDSFARDFCLDDGSIYTANGYFGIQKYDISTIVPNINNVVTPAQHMKIDNYPNPFNPSTTIRFELPESGWVKMDIYNIKGQHIRNLLDEHRLNGQNQVVWNGTNDNGKTVASGVYLVKVSSGQYSASRKVIMVK
ncbi:MAG TPA: T9SS type A sorting domain-containing protein [Candidatus Cloacimonadota bacterium]|nr:T9SS type A sorting domain-containing protein [Candidatus Cloacimonadota bacterium]HPT71599.1 T9SS type A sorting domain-containing protein [Candidatus Cloacimonadota bacterium]